MIETDIQTRLTDIAKANGGIIDNKTAEQNGISRAVLSSLCKKGVIERINRGQYVFPDTVTDEIFATSKRSDYIIISHETSLFLHGISDRIPFVHSVTAPSDKIPSKALKSDCKIYYIKAELFELGKTVVKTPSGNEVDCYDLERTVCDIVRSRSRIGTETFLSAIKAYAARRDKNLNLLYEYAKKMKISGVMRQYLEVLL